MIASESSPECVRFTSLSGGRTPLEHPSAKLLHQEAATAGEFDIKCMLFDM